MADFEFIRYEGVTNQVARIVLARAEKRNAQNAQMLYELNDAFDLAAQDDDCKVIGEQGFHSVCLVSHQRDKRKRCVSDSVSVR